MPDHAFRAPPIVLVGMGFPKQIRNVMDAIAYLDEQPSTSRDEAFQAARGACRDALNRIASIEEARDMFCALARRRGVLVEESRGEENWASPTLAVDRPSPAATDDDRQAV